MSDAPKAFFLPMVGRGSRFALHHAPVGGALRGAVVYVHPFAEEMNKSRRMAAMASRELAKSGYAVLQMDLLGCGDSSGEFCDATWDDWVADVVEAGRWMLTRNDVPLTLWGLRAGCLVATQAARTIAASVRLLLWQPALSGKSVLNHFLRLRLAAELDGRGSKVTMDDLRRTLMAGKAVTVAGYDIAAALANGLDQAELTLPEHTGPVDWLEVSMREDASLLPGSARLVQHWLQLGHKVTAAAVRGPAFWQTVEIDEAPALLAATVRALLREQTA